MAFVRFLANPTFPNRIGPACVISHLLIITHAARSIAGRTLVILYSGLMCSLGRSWCGGAFYSRSPAQYIIGYSVMNSGVHAAHVVWSWSWVIFNLGSMGAVRRSCCWRVIYSRSAAQYISTGCRSLKDSAIRCASTAETTCSDLIIILYPSSTA